MVAKWVGNRAYDRYSTMGGQSEIFFKADYPITQVQFAAAGSPIDGSAASYHLSLHKGTYSNRGTGEVIEQTNNPVELSGTTVRWYAYYFKTSLIPGENYYLRFTKVSGSSGALFYYYNPSGVYYTGWVGGGYSMYNGYAFQTLGDPDFVKVKRWDGTAWQWATVKRGVGGQWVTPQQITMTRT